jgi:phenylacetate-coenzyme A ligase PaaK-like adenylate-forming protein
MTRAELERAQLLALRTTLEHAVRHSPFYQKHLGSLAKVAKRFPGSLSDLATLPFLCREHIIEQGHLMLSVSQSKVARIITMQTSGSTGTPKRLAFSAQDLTSTMDFFLHGMYSLIDRTDRVLVMLPFELPASVGELLIAALGEDGILSEGMWPPVPGQEVAGRVHTGSFSCAVGLPQHLLALSANVGEGQLKSMLLCSDYAPAALRRRIEKNCGCETFLHYGATESGLGGAVECGIHDGCHIRESDLLIEIIDPKTGKVLPDGECGEVVLTTLGREAMSLIRYRTGDIASLDRSGCACGGVTARLKNIRGRMER